MNTRMEVNDFFAIINTPDALKNEDLNALPPHDPVNAFVVDEYPACPKTWMHGSSKASSYFVGVESGKGMWFDFTSNQYNKYDVAVVVSVQGINPVTGMPTSALNLEQYKNKCPIHNVEFQQDRFCPDCGYKWPAQNYIASTTGQTMWIDGFRNEKGEVRQYIITEEECNGVAAQIIGEERVYAIGFAFYRSKKPKPVVERNVLSTQNWVMKNMSSGISGYQGSWGDVDNKVTYTVGGSSLKCCASSIEPCANFAQTENTFSFARGMESMESSFDSIDSAQMEAEQAKLEIGAGSRIDQEHGVDPNDMDFWEELPDGMIYVNYILKEIAQKIIDAGKRIEKKDGFLAGLTIV